MAAYYNEIDPYAAQWLRNLITAGHIAPGDVDERSIEAVQPDDVRGYTQCHFFAGIGGWSYALRLAGWPDGEPVWTGSCPCQPYSSAGHQQGAADARNLWPFWFRLIRECRPGRVFGEQVDRAVGHGWLDAVSTDMEAEGYAFGACVLGAHSAGAPHTRPRLWFVADASGQGLSERPALGRGARTSEAPSTWREFERVHGTNAWLRWDAESQIRVFAHGVPAVGGRLRALGNAIVPQVAAEFIGAYLDVINGDTCTEMTARVEAHSGSVLRG